ncbi:hypothetical protein [Nocardia sp. SYP-A9097]|uniref:hypothetical protein n=1 Tax=Nocardia sp. SYP-A9097 TaxID=2663237 RepID=UPI00129B7F32|nr:hypothetical protein [Nocardia sp. SYP-A9097]
MSWFLTAVGLVVVAGVVGTVTHSGAVGAVAMAVVFVVLIGKRFRDEHRKAMARDAARHGEHRTPPLTSESAGPGQLSRESR